MSGSENSNSPSPRYCPTPHQMPLPPGSPPPNPIMHQVMPGHSHGHGHHMQAQHTQSMGYYGYHNAGAPTHQQNYYAPQSPNPNYYGMQHSHNHTPAPQYVQQPTSQWQPHVHQQSYYNHGYPPQTHTPQQQNPYAPPPQPHSPHQQQQQQHPQQIPVVPGAAGSNANNNAAYDMNLTHNLGSPSNHTMNQNHQQHVVSGTESSGQHALMNLSRFVSQNQSPTPPNVQNTTNNHIANSPSPHVNNINSRPEPIHSPVPVKALISPTPPPPTSSVPIIPIPTPIPTTTPIVNNLNNQIPGTGAPTTNGGQTGMMPVRLQNMAKGARTKASMRKMLLEQQIAPSASVENHDNNLDEPPKKRIRRKKGSEEESNSSQEIKETKTRKPRVSKNKNPDVEEPKPSPPVVKAPVSRSRSRSLSKSPLQAAAAAMPFNLRSFSPDVTALQKEIIPPAPETPKKKRGKKEKAPVSEEKGGSNVEEEIAHVLLDLKTGKTSPEKPVDELANSTIRQDAGKPQNKRKRKSPAKPNAADISVNESPSNKRKNSKAPKEPKAAKTKSTPVRTKYARKSVDSVHDGVTIKTPRKRAAASPKKRNKKNSTAASDTSYLTSAPTDTIFSEPVLLTQSDTQIVQEFPVIHIPEVQSDNVLWVQATTVETKHGDSLVSAYDSSILGFPQAINVNNYGNISDVNSFVLAKSEGIPDPVGFAGLDCKTTYSKLNSEFMDSAVLHQTPAKAEVMINGQVSTPPEISLPPTKSKARAKPRPRKPKQDIKPKTEGKPKRQSKKRNSKVLSDGTLENTAGVVEQPPLSPEKPAAGKGKKSRAKKSVADSSINLVETPKLTKKELTESVMSVIEDVATAVSPQESELSTPSPRKSSPVRRTNKKKNAAIEEPPPPTILSPSTDVKTPKAKSPPKRPRKSKKSESPVRSQLENTIENEIRIEAEAIEVHDFPVMSIPENDSASTIIITAPSVVAPPVPTLSPPPKNARASAKGKRARPGSKSPVVSSVDMLSTTSNPPKKTPRPRQRKKAVKSAAQSSSDFVDLTCSEKLSVSPPSEDMSMLTTTTEELSERSSVSPAKIPKMSKKKSEKRTPSIVSSSPTSSASSSPKKGQRKGKRASTTDLNNSSFNLVKLEAPASKQFDEITVTANVAPEAANSLTFTSPTTMVKSEFSPVPAVQTPNKFPKKVRKRASKNNSSSSSSFPSPPINTPVVVVGKRRKKKSDDSSVSMETKFGDIKVDESPTTDPGSKDPTPVRKRVSGLDRVRLDVLENETIMEVSQNTDGPMPPLEFYYQFEYSQRNNYPPSLPAPGKRNKSLASQEARKTEPADENDLLLAGAPLPFPTNVNAVIKPAKLKLSRVSTSSASPKSSSSTNSKLSVVNKHQQQQDASSSPVPKLPKGKALKEKHLQQQNNPNKSSVNSPKASTSCPEPEEPALVYIPALAKPLKKPSVVVTAASLTAANMASKVDGKALDQGQKSNNKKGVPVAKRNRKGKKGARENLSKQRDQSRVGPSLRVKSGVVKFYRGSDEEDVDVPASKLRSGSSSTERLAVTSTMQGQADVTLDTVIISNLSIEVPVVGERPTDTFDSNVPWICVFCRLGPHVQRLGDLFGPYYVNTSPDSLQEVTQGVTTNSRSLMDGYRTNAQLLQKTETWMHQDCALWAGGVLLIGTSIRGLDKAVYDSNAVICTLCKEKGATIGCLDRGCSQAAHFPCAQRSQWNLDDETFHSHCGGHSSF